MGKKATRVFRNGDVMVTVVSTVTRHTSTQRATASGAVSAAVPEGLTARAKPKALRALGRWEADHQG